MLCVYCEIKSHYLQLELLSLILLKRTGILSLAIFTAHDACDIYVRGEVRNTFMLSACLYAPIRRGVDTRAAARGVYQHGLHVSVLGQRCINLQGRMRRHE